ncbi:YtxH domain-containing protein [Fredinandcohnia sp. 179-A 10B2 NHS]|uniref:YtxH domain-containing protein n=1 Tax=Fredinandcohnia sp. 179-A 10B2 NHS TaxID=3235176 RepID=UPI00399FFE6A
MDKTKSLLYGVAIGTVIGGISVLLSTPTTGKDLRKVLRNNQKGLPQVISHVVADGKNLKNKVVSSTKHSVSTISDFSTEVKQSIMDWRQDVEGNQKNIQKELLEIESALQNLEESVLHK